MTTWEYHRRFDQRCAPLGLDAMKVAKIALQHYCGWDCAVRIACLPWHVDKSQGRHSNGDELWVVVRDGCAITVFFR
jgi:hypothetical protein